MAGGEQILEKTLMLGGTGGRRRRGRPPYNKFLQAHRVVKLPLQSRYTAFPSPQNMPPCLLEVITCFYPQPLTTINLFCLSGGASSKEPICQCRSHKRCWFDPWVGKIPWKRKCNPLQYSCLENPMDREAWWATVQGVTESDPANAA